MIAHDPLNAFTRHTHVALGGSGAGPLAGLTMAVKDVYDIAGHRTGNGNPVWLETHLPAQQTASSVQLLLDAGARMVGKTHTDELAYSLNGENVHYGTPTNPKAMGRIPGGSSSGSAAAVSGELVDFALGTDCGGSVRLPASYCGIYGIRTSHGLIAADGIVPLAASFDTVGWFARTASLMQQVGDVLLPASASSAPTSLLIAADAFGAVDPAIVGALQQGIAKVKAAFRTVRDVNVYTGDPSEWSALFRILQGDEIRQFHWAWINRHRPEFGPGIRESFQWTQTIDPDEVAKAKPKREMVAQQLARLLDGNALLCLPTAPGIAPKLNTPAQELEAFRARAFALLAIAGLARLPQINLPVATLDGCPIGLSLIAPRGFDRALLQWTADHFA
ncbi:amidase [Bradyrhizobium sp.]|uniref:amidase n=1 Tax=Bradyrhizobium sp. TaxID=376 RepID=UPI003C5514C3